jgi:hypothetical protein
MPSGAGTYGKNVGRPKKNPRPAINAPMSDKRSKEAIAALNKQKKEKKKTKKSK